METLSRLYVVAGVPRSYDFKPTTRNEIKECRWFTLDTLPTSRMDNSKSDLGIYPNNFYMVFPYVEQIKKWVSQRRGGRHSSAGSRFQGGASTTPTTTTNGDHRPHHPHYDQRTSRSSPRTRSISHSSPLCHTGGHDYNRQNLNGIHTTADKHQRNSSTKQPQKKNKKTSTVCRQKLDFESAGESEASNAAVSPKPDNSTKSATIKQTNMTASAEAALRDIMKSAVAANVEIQPSQAWQQFRFNWEPIYSAM